MNYPTFFHSRQKGWSLGLVLFMVLSLGACAPPSVPKISPPATVPSSAPVITPTPPEGPVTHPTQISATSPTRRYGDTWELIPAFLDGFRPDPTLICSWTMKLGDGRQFRTTGPASGGWCGSWQVTIPYLAPTSSGARQAIKVDFSAGTSPIVGSASVVVAAATGASTDPKITTSNLPLLWLEAPLTLQAGGVADVHFFWLGQASTSLLPTAVANGDKALTVTPINGSNFIVGGGRAGQAYLVTATWQSPTGGVELSASLDRRR